MVIYWYNIGTMLSKMQLLNVLLFALFFGVLSAHLAKKQRRNPLTWFLVGFFLGLFGVGLICSLPFVERWKAQRKHKPVLPLRHVQPPPPPERSHIWYYLDAQHQEKGPIELPDLVQIWKEKQLGKNSYVWSAGMPEWKKLSELPELLDKIQGYSKIRK